MTKITKLVIHGFKSFANRTEFVFGDNFNCVLGPNGSGKSNVLDALCFVLGRMGSKSLRAEKSANLIFNGGKKKKAADKGEVHISFDNTSKVFPVEEPEVKLSRIIRKNGQSTYRINGRTRTRNEVVELLSAARIDPDGYNIILQGDITRFIEMSPLERRQLVEEISGVSVYEERKHKALLELEKVGKKLEEAEIVLNERKTHLRELKKDRDQALKFRELQQHIESNKASYITLQMEKKIAVRDRLEQEAAQLREKLQKLEQQIQGGRQLIEQKKEDAGRINTEIEQKGEVEQVKLNKSIENRRVQLEKQKNRVEMIKDALAKIKARKQSLGKDHHDIGRNITELEEKKQQLLRRRQEKERELEQLEQRIALFKKKNKIGDVGGVEREIEELEKSMERKQEEMHQLREKQQELLRQKDRLEYQIQTLDERARKVASVAKENRQQLDELKQKRARFITLTNDLNAALDADTKYAGQLGESRKQLHAQQEEQARLQARQAGAEERVTSSIAMKKILALKRSGVYGTVAKLGHGEGKYALALEIAAGSRLHSIVVEDEKVAAECIRYLKDNKFGVATFIPLSRIKAPAMRDDVKPLAKERGVHGFAVDLISFDERFAPAFRHVFADTLVVDDLSVARRIGIGKARMVTLDGDLAEQSGVMRGGYHTKRVPAFAESSVAQQLQSVEKQLAMLRAAIADITGRKELNEERLPLLRKEKLALEGELARLEKTLHVGVGDLDATMQEKEQLAKGLAEVEKQLRDAAERVQAGNHDLAAAKTKKEQLKLTMTQLRNPRLLAELGAFEEARQAVRETALEIKGETDTLDRQVATVLRPEQERIGALVKGHTKEEAQFAAELQQLQQEIGTGDRELQEQEKALRTFMSAYRDLFTRRDRLAAETSGLESRIDAHREQSRKMEIEINTISLKLASVKSELAGLETQFEPVRNGRILRGKGEDELKLEIAKFERMLASMSAVNMKALEIYEQVEAEYQKLLEKRETLLKEKTGVVGLMDEIEGKKKEQFSRTFKEINENFQRKFALLSRKGNAYLQLDVPEKPFDGGLNVKVRLIGQRYLDIKSLSGGEKTMTALAFIFAIQEHQPHSFYVLDEVDAALDKHNSEKLAKLIREYCRRAQYLIISHNDALITEADTLYGVSMDEFGVSKVVSLKV